MKTFRKYFENKEGLAALGDQDLSNDLEDNAPSMSGDETISSNNEDEASLVRRAIKITLKAGEKHRQKLFSFLNRLARELPELQNIVSQLKSDDGDNKDPSLPPSENKGDSAAPVVSTPIADSTPENEPE